MKAVVQHIKVEEGQRVIAVSDIHGNLDVFVKLMDKINLTKQDILIIGGDLIEKGPRNLDTLHYIMNLQKEYQVYPLLGNCDAVILSLTRPEENERLRNYMKSRRSTVVEMCKELKIALNDKTDFGHMKLQIQIAFRNELQWLASLPHIVAAGDYIFTHAALKSEKLEENSVQDVLRQNAFMEKNHKFQHTLVVGHWPVVLYDEAVIRCSPIINREKNIISIDGGNVLNIEGQLNALIIPNAYEKEVSFESMDLLPRAYVKESKFPPEDQTSIHVTWEDGQVSILERKDEFCYCRHCSTGYKLWILSAYLYRRNGGWWAEDCTDYVLPVTVGDEVAIVENTSRGYLIKKDGIVGWYDGELTIRT